MIATIVRGLFGAAILAAGFWSTSAYADARGCDRREAMAAEEESSKLKSWAGLYRSYNMYSHCDEGAISEGYSYSVAFLLTERWVDFGELLELSERSHDFEDFVVSHVNETMSQSQASQLLQNLSARCPRSGARLCSRLNKAVDASS